MANICLPYKYEPRSYQVPLWQHMQGSEEGKRAVAVWHRRAGKDLFAINMTQTKVMERIGVYWHMLPTYKQGRAIVWNGFTRDGRKFLDHFHPAVVESVNNTNMTVTFKNGSIYQVVGTDDVNSLVGTNPIGVVFSEYSLHDPAAWNYIRPILAENGGWAVFIYTARGKNHGYHMLEMAKKNHKWFQQVLVAGSGPDCTKRPDGTPVISDEVIEEERKAGMPEEMVQQEFKCSFEAPLVGAFYGPQMMRALDDKRITNVPYEPKLPVHTSWDLGIGDSTVIWFFQVYGMETRVIDYYENSGEGLGHYAKVLKGQVENGAHRADYLYGIHYAPHDIEVTELGTGKTRLETAKMLGMKFKVVQRHEVEDGIEAVRNLIPQCWFDALHCERGIEGLRQYRKEWDDLHKCFKSNPLHDWASHPADGFRYYAMGRRERAVIDRNQRPRKAVDNHDYAEVS